MMVTSYIEHSITFFFSSSGSSVQKVIGSSAIGHKLIHLDTSSRGISNLADDGIDDGIQIEVKNNKYNYP